MLWLLACSSAPVTWPVAPAYDVPAPPGHVSMDLGPVSSQPFEPGAAVSLLHGGLRMEAEVVDVRTLPDGTMLTVYADDDAQAWLDAVDVRVEVHPR